MTRRSGVLRRQSSDENAPPISSASENLDADVFDAAGDGDFDADEADADPTPGVVSAAGAGSESEIEDVEKNGVEISLGNFFYIRIFAPPPSVKKNRSQDVM